jgi:hypothetical protein
MDLFSNKVGIANKLSLYHSLINNNHLKVDNIQNVFLLIFNLFLDPNIILIF